MGTQLPLPRQLAKFLLVYRTMPHTTTEMRPDELFLRCKLRTRLTLIQPSLFATVQKHHLQQKRRHDNSKPPTVFKKGEFVLVRNHRSKTRWLKGKILRQKGPVSYLVQVRSTVRFCHVDHLIRRNTTPESKADAASEETQQSASDFTWLPQDEPDVAVVPQNVSEGNQSGDENRTTEVPQPQRSSQLVQPPQRLIEEI